MPGLIPDNILDEILSRCDIVEIISSYIPLRRVGRSHKAHCPFHHEKTPSFIVNPQKGIFHCFGCGVGGNVFSFIMKYEKLEFPEVVKMLAKRTGVALPEQSAKSSRESSSAVDALYRIHEFATAYFQNTLMSPSARHVREYLVRRGIKNETAREFRLGFAPNSWDSLFSYLRSKGFKEDITGKAGLIIPRPEGSGHYDRFRGRLIFPIFNQRGKVVAFAGRVLDDSMPKYVNSPETQVYNKSRTLFGLNFAKGEIGKKDVAVAVEGYMDLIVPYQSGMKNIIASCGTALTPGHIRLLKRYTHNVIMVYDSDKAGEMATLRGLDLLIAEDMNVGIVRLPKGFDPDSYVRKYEVAAFQELLRKPIGLLEYKLSVLTSIHGADGAESKARVAAEMLATISKINNAIRKSEYIKRLADSLKVDESDLRTELSKVKKEYADAYEINTRPLKDETVAFSAADKIIIGLMIEDSGLIPVVKKKLAPDEFRNKFTQKIIDFIFRSDEEKRPVTYSAVITHLDIKGLDGILSEIAAKHSTFVDKMKNLEDCITWIKRDNLKRNLSELRNRIKSAQSEEEENRLLLKCDKLTREYARYGNGRLRI